MNVLVVYYYRNYPCRTAILDHIYAFRRYSGHRVFHWNMVRQKVPAYLRRMEWDVVIFHTTFLYQRLAETRFSQMKKCLAFLKDTPAAKVALPQDETSNTDGLIDFFREFGVDVVFSVAPESEIEKLYGNIPGDTIEFRRALTGYLDERTVRRIERLRKKRPRNPIDIGYRSFRATARLGRLGVLKWKVAEQVIRAAPRYKLSTDISTAVEDTLTGDDWFRFLLSCRYQLGTESGASVRDPDGSIRECCQRYEMSHPRADFEEVEAACFPGRDGDIRYAAIGPRHLEACATQSCQILVEGSYNGILTAGIHYIPIKADFSNLDEVLASLDDEPRRRRIVDRAYQDIVLSRRYGYEQYVNAVLESAMISQRNNTAPSPMAIFSLCSNKFHEWSIWRYVQCRSLLVMFHHTIRTPLLFLKERRRWLARLLIRDAPAIGATLRSIYDRRQR